MRVVNDLHSLADNNLKAPANQTAQGQSSFAGQWDNSLGFVGVSSKTYGTLTFGRVSALSTGVISAYDPVSSIAFSLLGFSGPFTGFGTSELSPVNTGFVYRWGYQNFRVAGLAQVGGYTIGNGTMGEYQGQVGATFGGLSIDAILSYAKDAVSQLTRIIHHLLIFCGGYSAKWQIHIANRCLFELLRATAERHNRHDRRYSASL